MRELLAMILLLAHVGSAVPGRPPSSLPPSSRVRIRIEHPREGAPILFGLPFPKGALHSPDHVRVLAPDGREIPSQITEVNTWAPADESVKWIWVFFFAEAFDEYFVEYGPTVRRTWPPPQRAIVINNQGERGFAEVTTGPLRFLVRKGEGGFLHRVQLDVEGNGFDESDVIAEGPVGRGSFLDFLDDAGVDPSRAVVTRTVVEKGSGPLHIILRVEGEYRYARADNPAAPFVMRIHAYAGKPYIRVLHTFIYTGVPDKHRPLEGEHAHVATQGEKIRREEPGDPGWTQPNDRIAAVGLALDVKLSSRRRMQTVYREGKWWQDGRRREHVREIAGARTISLLQSGPQPTRMPPVPESTPDRRLEGFFAHLDVDEQTVARAERADGWLSLSDERWGVAVGIRHFLEEYPKELRWEAPGRLTAFLWSPRVEPMSFARWSSELEYEDGSEGTVENWAQGLAKTSELILYFHKSGAADIERTMSYVLAPPVAHADPTWYAESGVYGRFAPRTDRFPEFERALDYKFEWWLFNQRWAPWFGMFDYGDGKLNFDGEKWDVWVCNEPAVDFMLWFHFLRTGDRRIYLAAEAASRHSMDVDNTHWPADPKYYGDTNSALDFWETLRQPPGTKYLGIGRRHGMQHWSRALSAHVWVAGWLASYYLSGYHRGLEVAIQTAETYLKRIWGDHDLTGRRLYLSVWNLVEVWDATKEERYHQELRDRIARMLFWQEREQGGSLVMDRFGYAQNYASHALARYLDLTGDPRVRAALVRHARRVRDVPPLSHRMESYLATIHSLVVGYDLTGDPSFLQELRQRIEPLKMEALPRPIDDSWTQRELFAALEKASHLPRNPDGSRPIWSFTHGLRVFGWTHAYGVPYALRVLARP
ncbi:MAG: hypothetical protein N0A16_09185 [Blastocatellia bacterium]|nr:hypothetical protein [Blastocatellia bacterium]MCS7157888.1 hypothetical protein [Blastocatellia bacterium]MDW8168034.1 hypothetical protein [Acidobacteriota bacterium]